MAKRQALQNLQKRIASMLQDASNQNDNTALWLGAHLGKAKMLFPLQQIGEIYPINDQIHGVAYSKPWFLGVLAVRGQIHGVVELIEFLTHLDKTCKKSAEKQQCLVALNDSFGVNVLLRVDGLEGLLGQDSFATSQPAAPSDPDYYGSIFYEQNGTSWQEINLQLLCQTEQFLDIAAPAQIVSHTEIAIS